VAAAQASHLTETGMVMGTAMYVSPEQATGAPVTDASDIYSLGVVAYECLAGHPPFTASEPLAIAFAHKHEPVPALPPDVPPPVSDLVYHMLAKTPAERPASVRVVADRADMLRDALALGESGKPAEYLGATRADLPTAATGALFGEEDPGSGRPRGAGARRASRRQLVAGGSTAVLCAAAVATGLYLTSHSTGQTSGNAGNNALQHPNSPSAGPSRGTASPHSRPTPSNVVVVRQKPSPSPTVGNPKPTKTVKPTPSPKPKPTASPSATPSSSPTPTSSSSSASPSPSSSSSP
jgi:serine/threonine-protein kinase